MKRLTNLMLSLICLSFYSCDWKTNGSGQDQSDSIDTNAFSIISVELPRFMEVTGTVGDGTSMNSLELITEKGDTLLLNTTGTNFIGELYVGQKIDVFYNSIEDEDVASVVVNLTQMQSKWAQVNRMGEKVGMWLTPDGKVLTDSTDVGYTRWAICDGAIVLSYPITTETREMGTVFKADTFFITTLDNENLRIARGHVGYSFVREL